MRVLQSIRCSKISIKVVCNFLCYIGCASQLSQVIINYLAFEYETVLEVSIPEFLVLPDLTFCYDILYGINKTKLSEKYPSISGMLMKHYHRDGDKKLKTDNNSRDIAALFASQLTVQQITEISYTADELISEIQIFDDNSVKNPELCKINNYYTENLSCFHYNCSQKSIQGLNVGNHAFSAFQGLFQTFLNQKVVSQIPLIEFSLSVHNELPWGKRAPWTSITMSRKPVNFMVSYAMLLEKRLPFPYPTNCFNYKEKGFPNRAAALNDCLNSKARKYFGTSFHSSFVSAHENVKLGSFDYRANFNNKTYRQLISVIENKCNLETKQVDCFFVQFSIANNAPTLSSFNNTYIFIEMLKTPIIINFYLPQIYWVDLFISIGNIMGFWFGFSVNTKLSDVSGNFISYLSTFKSFFGRGFVKQTNCKSFNHNFVNNLQYFTRQLNKSKRFYIVYGPDGPVIMSLQQLNDLQFNCK